MGLGKMRYAAFALLFAFVCAGCVSTHRTVEVDRPYERSQITTTTTDTVEPPHEEGILSTTVDVIGDVISWPFRVIGKAFEAIF